MLTRRLPLVSMLLLVLAGCRAQTDYAGRGRIVGFGDDGRTVLIEHEDIPGLMPAMTMPFRTHPGTNLDTFHVQDAVGFTLILTADSSWIQDLVRLPDSLVAAHPAGQPDQTFAPQGISPLLDIGDPVPTDTLIDQNRRPFTLADFRGQAVLLTFIYTRCPLPDFCPRLSERFQALQARLADRYDEAVQLLSISFDPEHDTPEVLRAYARRYTDATDQWTFATGSADAIHAITSAFGVYYEANRQDFDHNLTTALIDPSGHVRRIWRGTGWTPEMVMDAVHSTLESGVASD